MNDASWLKERLEASRREIKEWPEWRKKELQIEIGKTPVKKPQSSRGEEKDPS
jgi:hypothetical protein